MQHNTNDAFYPHPQHYDEHLFQSLVDSVEVAHSTSGGRRGIVNWIEKNTADPLDSTKPWSFKDHEFQIGIAECQAPRVVVLKRSQVGVSELFVRITLALLSKLPGRHAIYTLPDSQFARDFSPTRFTPVVQASERLKALVSDDLNNSRVKQIGTSYLHISGAQKESQSISVPATIMLHDETAYSNQAVLGTYSSRLGHVRKGEEIVYRFSTPLLPNFSIHQDYLDGTQNSYMCYHDSCGTWVVLDPIADLILPGIDIPIDMLSKSDVNNNRDKVARAYARCPHCHKPVSVQNLADPSKRAWVPAHPDRYVASFDANWTALASIMTPERVLLDRLNYGSTEKWVNFVIGRPADSADNRLSEVAISNAFAVNRADNIHSFLNVAGMDIGKTCHLVIGSEVGEALVIKETRLPKQTHDNNSAFEFIEAYKRNRCSQGVIDAMPEFTVATAAQAELPFNQVWGAYFVRGVGKQDLDFFAQDEGEGVVKIQRTKALDEFASDFNKGRILFYRDNEHKETIRTHLRALARVTEKDATGTEVSSWVSVGEDHFFFALLYCWTAWRMARGSGVQLAGLDKVQPLFGKVRVK